jgi:hypothetical protein
LSWKTPEKEFVPFKIQVPLPFLIKLFDPLIVPPNTAVLALKPTEKMLLSSCRFPAPDMAPTTSVNLSVSSKPELAMVIAESRNS